MSRCYPFPPPGYVRNGVRDEALIESIKREEEKAKKERKKERKREKKEKRKERESGADGSNKQSHKRRHKDDTKDNQKVINNCKIIDNDSEFLEKSCLTDERENQTASQNSCDSTINSNERLKQSPPLDGKHNSSESIIRIRLPVKRQKGPEVLLTSKDEQPYSFRGRIEASQPAPRELVDQPCSTSASVAPQHALRPSEENRKNSFSGSPRPITMRLRKEKTPSSCIHPEQPMVGLREEKQCSTMEEMVQPSSLCTICPPKEAVQWLNLIDNWAPHLVERELADSEDQEWWFNKPNSQKISAERCQVSSLNTSQGSSSTQWPSACFLPEADIYALPYTVPL